MHQSTTPSLSKTIWPGWASIHFLTAPVVQTLLPVTFGYSLSSEAVVMRQLKRWKRLWQRSLTRSHKKITMGPSKSCWNGTTSASQPGKITSKGTRVSCVFYQWKCRYEKSLENYLMIRVFLYMYESLIVYPAVQYDTYMFQCFFVFFVSFSPIFVDFLSAFADEFPIQVWIFLRAF